MLSDARLRDALRLQLHRAVHVDRRLSRAEIAADSGVNIHTIDAILSRDPAKHRTIGAGVALSLAVVLGCRAVNAVLALIGYGGAEPLDEIDAQRPAEIVADGFNALAVVANAARDGKFDHTEMPDVMEAADQLVATFLPLSSAKQAV